jgi:hypothetical protein
MIAAGWGVDSGASILEHGVSGREGALGGGWREGGLGQEQERSSRVVYP